MPSPTRTTETNIFPPPASATAGGGPLIPLILLGSPSGQAGAAAPTPTPQILLLAPPATANAAPTTPTELQAVLIQAVAALATASMPAPSPELRILAAPGTAHAQVPIPIIPIPVPTLEPPLTIVLVGPRTLVEAAQINAEVQVVGGADTTVDGEGPETTVGRIKG